MRVERRDELVGQGEKSTVGGFAEGKEGGDVAGRGGEDERMPL